MSIHCAEVVPVVLEKHPNADNLSIAKIRGWQVIVKTDDFKNKPLGIFVPVDMILPNTKEWEWLENRRVKTRKFRGAISQGILIPAEYGMRIGDDVTEQIGATRYVPKMPGNKSGLRGGQQMAPPPGMIKYTDIENWKNYTDVFAPGENVVVTEKIHGANARFALLDGVFYVGSHNTVRKPIPQEPTSWFGKKWIAIKRNFNLEPPKRTPDEWQKVAERNSIEARMRGWFGDENVILFGEIYGPKVQSVMNYGVDETKVAFFDVFVGGRFLPFIDVKACLIPMGLPVVPQLGVFGFGPKIFGMVDGPAFSGGHVREGIVFRSYPNEEYHPKLGRKVVKLISEKYLLKDYDDVPDDTTIIHDACDDPECNG